MGEKVWIDSREAAQVLGDGAGARHGVTTEASGCYLVAG
jgi:hypothetical protein